MARWIAGGKTFRWAWSLRGSAGRSNVRLRFVLGSSAWSWFAAAAASPHGKLGYRAQVRLPDLAFDVWVIGLDSAWRWQVPTMMLATYGLRMLI